MHRRGDQCSEKRVARRQPEEKVVRAGIEPATHGFSVFTNAPTAPTLELDHWFYSVLPA